MGLSSAPSNSAPLSQPSAHSEHSQPGHGQPGHSQPEYSQPEYSQSWGTVSLPKSRLFGTDGIRGKVGDLLTAPLAMQVGFWAGQILQSSQDRKTDHHLSKGVVVIGQDSRNSSDMLAMALSAGLTAAGLEVWNIGLCPTPTVAYLAYTTEAIGGVMISASHNPPEDNGIKFFSANGTKLSTALQSRIESALRGEADFAPTLQWGRSHHRPELVSHYLEAVQRPLLPISFSGMKIVLDLAWGAAAQVAPQAFIQMGAEAICLHNRADGDRINVNCGSTHLEPLRAAVLNHRADLGFAFDGDADRVMAIDAQGRVVDGDYILYLWGQALRQANQLPDSLIVSTVMANLGFERAWQQQGGSLIRTDVGDQHVHAEMVKRGAKLGGEQSGHILCPHYGVSGDGLLTALHIAALVKQADTSLAELVSHSFQTYPQILRNVRVEDRDRRLNWQESELLQQTIAQAEAAMGDQGRVLVRASGTEPVIRVMVEAVTAELTQHWTDSLVWAVEQYAG